MEKELKLTEGEWKVLTYMCISLLSKTTPCRNYYSVSDTLVDEEIALLEKIAVMNKNGIMDCLLDKTERGLFEFLNYYWEDTRGGLETQALFDMQDDMDLCLMACMYGAEPAIRYKGEARFWIAGTNFPRDPKRVYRLADLVASEVDIAHILEHKALYKEFIDLKEE